MKTYLPYLIGGIALVAFFALLFGAVGSSKRTLNERVTLKQTDKIPYGFYTAKTLLPGLFPQAKIVSDKLSPGTWRAVSTVSDRQAVFIIGDLNASNGELDRIREFVKLGNHVFFISRHLSDDAKIFFGLDDNDVSPGIAPYGGADSLAVSLDAPRFTDTTKYFYPGLRYASVFDSIYPSKSIVLGRDRNNTPNFLQFRMGAGSVYLHTAPLAFSNYFILHKDNVAYYQAALSVIPQNVTKILWNEYYLYKKTTPPESEPAWLSVLFRYKAFRWGFMTALGVLLLYLLMEIRRKQRIIPHWPASKNDSLDFVQTIGRLYYDQRNHQDLALKMSAFFLDHVRSRYNLRTAALDNDFITALSGKAAYPADELTTIVNGISTLPDKAGITEQELAQFHKKLEKFYQQT